VIITTANSKGGVGKSTIAVHLAVWLHEKGQHVILVDADMQQSSSRWIKDAVPQMSVVSYQTPDEVLEEVPRLEREASLVVADGPAGMAELTRALLMIADLALVPCGPSALDLEASTQAVRVIRQARDVRKNGLPHALFVVNKLQPQTRLSRELLESAATIGIPVARTALHFRQVYADAPGQRSVVWKMGYRGTEGAAELHQLFLEVTSHGKTSPTDRRDKR
jgi:chromosome partitioning protein